jgi:hypothetical protein
MILFANPTFDSSFAYQYQAQKDTLINLQSMQKYIHFIFIKKKLASNLILWAI